MPLTDLIRYFNAADNADDSLLYSDDTRAAAWHRGLRLSSRFRPIVDLHQEKIVGHQAVLHATREDGTPVDNTTAYALNEGPAEIVRFDRLCRTLHALNFLAQRRHTGGYLQMPVHPRHLQAVQNQHGLVYEAILKRCGLAPEDIVLSIAATAEPASLLAAIDNYRRRGYRLALHQAANDTDPAIAGQLRPDILLLGRPPWPALRDIAADLGIRLEAAGIDRGNDLEQARAARIDLATGQLFGALQIDCLPTHSKRGVAYNSASPHESPS